MNISRWPMQTVLRHIESGDLGVLRTARKPMGCPTIYRVEFTGAFCRQFMRECSEDELTANGRTLHLVIDNTIPDTLPSEVEA